MLALANSVPSPNSFWIYILATVLGGVLIIGTVRLWPAARNFFRKTDQVEDMVKKGPRYDKAADIVLGDPLAVPPRPDLDSRMTAVQNTQILMQSTQTLMADQLRTLQESLKQNGKNTNSPGDTMGRTEDKVDRLTEVVDKLVAHLRSGNEGEGK